MLDKFWIREQEMLPPRAILKVGGNIGSKEANELRTKYTLLRDQGYRQLVLNMSEVAYISSSGISALIFMSEDMQNNGGIICLVSLSRTAERIFEHLNLNDYIIIKKNEEDALDNIENELYI